MRAPQLELPDYVAKLATRPSLERARAEATALVEQARVEAKAQLEQARAEPEQLRPSIHENPVEEPVRLADAFTGKDDRTLPFEPPPLSPEDLVATRPLPRFFGRGTRGLR